MPDFVYIIADAKNANPLLEATGHSSVPPPATKPRRQRRPNIGVDLAHYFADGQWHPLAEIAAMLQVELSHAERTLRSMKWTGAYGCRAEKRRGKLVQWRVFKIEKMVPVSELLSEVRPLVQALRVEGRKNMATMSPPTVAVLAGRLEKLLLKWSDRPQPPPNPRGPGRPPKGSKGSSHDSGRTTRHSSGPAQLPDGQLDHRTDDAGAGNTVRDNDSVSDGAPSGREEGETPPRED